MASIGKAYRNLVMKWNPDKYYIHKNDGKIQENSNRSYKNSNGRNHEEYWNEHESPEEENNFHLKRSVDDNFVIRSPSLLARTTSRRSHTPTPRLHKNTSRRSGVMESLKRSISRKATTSPSPIETQNNSLSKLMSQNDMKMSIDSNISRSKSRRSTTPIIYSQSTPRKKPHHVEKLLECSLEELCFGAIKKILVTKNVISDGIIIQEEETLQINVLPGWRKGTKITFEGKGDEKPGYLPADIVFLIDEKKHPLFKRVGDDLELEVEISLLRALAGCNISLSLLGGDKIVLGIEDVIYPGYEKIIQEQGMPKSKEKGPRGDLRLKFVVNFPHNLSDEKRSKICNILESCF